MDSHATKDKKTRAMSKQSTLSLTLNLTIGVKSGLAKLLRRTSLAQKNRDETKKAGM